MVRTRLGLVCAAAVLAAGVPARGEDAFVDLTTAITSFTVQEFQPDIKWSGRINSIAVHPGDSSRVIVGSDSGGLFETDTGGFTWRHLPGMPAYDINFVAYHPADPDVVFATARDDFSAATRAGIWRSTDGGTTWSQAAIATVPPAACRGTVVAWGISFDPDNGDVYVATDCGMAVSRDSGATWTRYTVPGFADRVFRSVQALGGGRVVGAGRSGVFYSTTSGTSWTAARGEGTPAGGPQVLARSINIERGVYLMDNRYQLNFSIDGGANWGGFGSPLPPPSGSGGIPFVKVSDDGPFDRLHVGNKYTLYNGRPAALTEADLDHGDTRDLALVNNRPRYLATDGGFHIPLGRPWTSIGGGRGGLHALQLYEVSGQRIGSPRRHDLYFGTQDNRVWSSDDGGRTWPYAKHWEGFYIQPQRSVSEEADARVLVTSCGGCSTRISGANYEGIREYDDPTVMAHDDQNKGYGHVGEGMVVQAGREAEGDPDVLYFTEDYGEAWRSIQGIPEEIVSIPHLSGPTRDPVAYIGVRRPRSAGGTFLGLLRASGIAEDGAHSLRYPAMTGHAGLGQRRFPSGYAHQAVFAVDPTDPMHLVAPDPADEQVKESWDGGETWTAIPGSRELVTRDGALRSLGGDTLISVIAFHPQEPTVALMGGREGGLYFSQDRGRRWRHVPGSEPIRFVSSIYWKSRNEVYVSSYGRGLWKLSIAYRAPFTGFRQACGGACFMADLSQPEAEPKPWDGTVTFKSAVFAFDGRALDGTAVDGVLRKVTLSQASDWMALGEPGQERDPVVSEGDEAGTFAGLEAVQRLVQAGWVIRGFTVSGDTVKHVLVGRDELRLKGAGKVVPFVDTGALESGVLQRATLRVDYDQKSGRVTFTGARFAPGRPVALSVDGRVLKTAPRPKSDGSFVRRVRLALDPGIYPVKAMQTKGKIVLSDATELSVGTNDNDEEPE